MGCETHVLGEETLETELVDVAVVVCFAGGFPEDAVCEEFALGGADEGVQTGFPGCVAVGLQKVIRGGGRGRGYKVVEEC